MVNFKKVLGLAAPALVFAGMAFGQTPVLCTLVSPGAPYIRAEGTTEQLPVIQVVCASAITGGPFTAQVFVTPTTGITSKVLNTSGATEAVAGINAGGPGIPPPTTATSYPSSGTVSGSQLNFTNITGSLGPGTALDIANIRIDATKIPVATGIPNAVSVSVFITSGNAVVATTAPTPVAYVVNGLSPTKASTAGNVAVCTGGSSTTAVVTLTVSEAFSGAFKAMAAPNPAITGFETEQSNVALGTPGSNLVNSGTRVKLVFAGVPTGASIYVPVSVALTNGDSIVLTSSETGAFSAVSAATGSGVPANSGLVTITNGGGQAVYEFMSTTNLAASDSFSIPVYLVASANSIVPSSTPMTVAVSFAPIGSTNIPNFAIGSNTSALPASNFSICQTNLLFSFVANTSGYDTGIAISNTSSDPFGKGGATSQNGNCTLNFYGTGAPSAAVVTPMINGGAVWAQVLSGFAPGFEGYMIAQCNFLFGHGFAFITTGLGTSAGAAEGYLANVIPSGTSRGALPAESLGN